MSKEKVFVIDGPNVHYVVNPNTEEGREDARVFLSDFEGVPYKWFKEATGKEHWVMYDSRAFEVIEKCGLKILHYISGCEIDPVMPVNGSSCNGMFEDVDLNNVSFDNFVTSDVVTMSYMFLGSTGVTNDTVKHLSTGKVTTMAYMFAESDVEYLDLSHFVTEKLTSVESMFESCELLEALEMLGWDFSNVADFTSMFSGCTELSGIYCSEDWNVSTDAGGFDMFLDCFSLPNFDDNEIELDMATLEDEGGYLSFS